LAFAEDFATDEEAFWKQSIGGGWAGLQEAVDRASRTESARCKAMFGEDIIQALALGEGSD